jgi:periplasmic divalent cation tolerance protein
MTAARVVLTTVGTEEEASSIGHELVARRHAACVNVLQIAQSVYRWKGKLCSDSEYLLVIKTLDSELPALEQAVRELHSYELPEIIVLPVESADLSFLTWISDCLDKEAEFPDESEGDLVFNPDDSNF